MAKRTALISVFNKTDIIEPVRILQDREGFNILASGGTAKAFKKEGIATTDVATLVGPPLLEHRVVTLSREVHAGLLARNTEEDRAELAANNIPFIDLVCVTFYPLLDEIKKFDATPASVLEKTDIGGPTMLRSAAKGRRIIVTPSYNWEFVLQWLEKGQPEKDKILTAMAAEAEAMVALYALASACYNQQSDVDNHHWLTAYRHLAQEAFPVIARAV